MKKTFLLFVAISSSCLLTNAQDNQTPYLTKSLSSANIRFVDLQTSGGSLQVNGVSEGEARLEVYVHGNNGRNNLSKAEIEERIAKNYNLDIDVSNGRLVAIAKPKSGFNNWRNSLSISFKAYVPKAASAKMRTSGGSLSLNGINGTIDGATSGGSIRIAAVNNDNISLRTSGGSIQAEQVSGTLSLHTSGGSIRLSQLKGKIDARTSGGSISADEVRGELLAKTSGGSIRVDRMSGSVDLATSAGSTNLNMLAVDRYVRVDVSAGSVNLQLPLNKGLDLNLHASRISLPSLNNFSGTREKDNVQGKLNGGGIPVDVHVSSGSLNFSAI